MSLFDLGDVATGGLISAGGSILGGLLGAQAAQTGASEQAGASRYAADLQKQMFDTQNAQLAPNRAAGYSALNQIAGVSCSPADGAFYAFANVEGAIAKMGLKNDLEFSEVLLNTVGVAVVPGSAFGLDGHMRISYATSLKTLEDAIARIKKAIEG
mgnify:CR=1 FL=1